MGQNMLIGQDVDIASSITNGDLVTQPPMSGDSMNIAVLISGGSLVGPQEILGQSILALSTMTSGEFRGSVIGDSMTVSTSIDSGVIAETIFKTNSIVLF